MYIYISPTNPVSYCFQLMLLWVWDDAADSLSFLSALGIFKTVNYSEWKLYAYFGLEIFGLIFQRGCIEFQWFTVYWVSYFWEYISLFPSFHPVHFSRLGIVCLGRIIKVSMVKRGGGSYLSIFDHNSSWYRLLWEYVEDFFLLFLKFIFDSVFSPQQPNCNPL